MAKLTNLFKTLSKNAPKYADDVAEGLGKALPPDYTAKSLFDVIPEPSMADIADDLAPYGPKATELANRVYNAQLNNVQMIGNGIPSIVKDPSYPNVIDNGRVLVNDIGNSGLPLDLPLSPYGTTVKDLLTTGPSAVDLEERFLKDVRNSGVHLDTLNPNSMHPKLEQAFYNLSNEMSKRRMFAPYFKEYEW